MPTYHNVADCVLSHHKIAIGTAVFDRNFGAEVEPGFEASGQLI